MLQSFTHWALVLATPAFLVGSSLAAQTTSPCGGAAFGGFYYGSQNNHPFTATVHITAERKLADGNVIRTDITLHQARDSAGRTRSESAAGCEMDDNGKWIAQLRVSISDSSARTFETWMESTDQPKTAEITHYPVPEPPSKEQIARQYIRLKTQRAANPVRTEKLGTRMIAGILAEGTRTTRTMPVGQIGNELPIETVEELWVSRDIGVMLLRSTDSPLSGRQSTEVTDITLGEPDAKLFAPPADYKVIDTEPKVIRTAAAAQPTSQ